MKVKSEREVAQSCLTLSDPMDSSPLGSSARGILQARVLEWGATAFSHYQLNGHEFEQTLGVDDGWGGLACCSPWGHKESDTTEYTCTHYSVCMQKVQY